MTLQGMRIAALMIALMTVIAGIWATFWPGWPLIVFTTEPTLLADSLLRVIGVFNVVLGCLLFVALIEFYSYTNSYSSVPVWYAALRFGAAAVLVDGRIRGLFTDWIWLLIAIDVIGGLIALRFKQLAVRSSSLRLAVQREVEEIKPLAGATPEAVANPVRANRHLRGGLSFFEHGQGREAVVLLHGFGANTFTWRHLIPALPAETFRVFALDLKGFGQSTRSKGAKGAYSLARQARLVLRFMSAKGLSDVHLVGHSMGGGVALLTAITLLAHRRRRGQSSPVLRSIVLLDTIAYWQWPPLFLVALKAPLLAWLLTHLLPVQFQVRLALRLSVADPGIVTEEMVRGYAEPLYVKGAREAMIAAARQLTPRDLGSIESRYRSIEVPTTLIWGRDDPLVPLRLGQRLQRALPQASLHVVSHCGHIPHEEAPGEVIPIIKDALTGRRADRAAADSALSISMVEVGRP